LQFVETTKEITLDASGGAADAQRVWLAPIGEPFRDINVAVTSLGLALPAGGVTWEVFYGGYFSGAPYDADSTHVGGISQSNGLFAGAAEVATVVLTDTDIFPSNLRVVSPNSDGTVTRKGYGGFPIVLELTNNAADPVSLVVSIIAKTVSIP
jgi:hypothetical protein